MIDGVFVGPDNEALRFSPAQALSRDQLCELVTPRYVWQLMTIVVASDAVDQCLRPLLSLDRLRLLPDGRDGYSVKNSGRRACRVRAVTLLEWLARRQTPDSVRWHHRRTLHGRGNTA